MTDLTYWPLREAIPSSVKGAYRRDYSKGSDPVGMEPPSVGPITVEGEYGSQSPTGSSMSGRMNPPMGRAMYHKDIGF